ncbi:MAG: hypothetical protein EXX96DRAFT_331145 [Benjaminiella poitrasii]|nr:MAG: hypothetical protein EXX96DRAFT_331145 [Benjaminiella poitrasii]
MSTELLLTNTPPLPLPPKKPPRSNSTCSYKRDKAPPLPPRRFSEQDSASINTDTAMEEPSFIKLITERRQQRTLSIVSTDSLHDSLHDISTRLFRAVTSSSSISSVSSHNSSGDDQTDASSHHDVQLLPLNHDPVVVVVRFAEERRNAEFHSLFQSVPDQDRLIEEYNCAMFKDIAIQGKLYISENHLCFNAKFFGWITNLVIEFENIQCIEKKTMALIVPNGIQITTKTDTKYVFASFMNRDLTFDQIYQAWQSSKSEEVTESSPKEKEEEEEENRVEKEEQRQQESNPSEESNKEKTIQYEHIVLDQPLPTKSTRQEVFQHLFNHTKGGPYVSHKLLHYEQCEELYRGDWEDKVKKSIFKKGNDLYEVLDREILNDNKQKNKICILSTISRISNKNRPTPLFHCKTFISDSSVRIAIDNPEYASFFTLFVHHVLLDEEQVTEEKRTSEQELNNRATTTTTSPVKAVESTTNHNSVNNDILSKLISVLHQSFRVLHLTLVLIIQKLNKKDSIFLIFTILNSLMILYSLFIYSS